LWLITSIVCATDRPLRLTMLAAEWRDCRAAKRNCPRRGTVRAAKTAGQGGDDVRVAEWEGEVGVSK